MDEGSCEDANTDDEACAIECSGIRAGVATPLVFRPTWKTAEVMMGSTTSQSVARRLPCRATGQSDSTLACKCMRATRQQVRLSFSDKRTTCAGVHPIHFLASYHVENGTSCGMYTQGETRTLEMAHKHTDCSQQLPRTCRPLTSSHTLSSLGAPWA